MRNEAQVLQTLDRFHRIDASIDLQRVYNDIFVPLPLESNELPVDIAAVFLICEWAVTNQRPAEYRYLSALSLLEMHSNALLTYGQEYEQHVLAICVSRWKLMSVLCCLLSRVGKSF